MGNSPPSNVDEMKSPDNTFMNLYVPTSVVGDIRRTRHCGSPYAQEIYKYKVEKQRQRSVIASEMQNLNVDYINSVIYNY